MPPVQPVTLKSVLAAVAAQAVERAAVLQQLGGEWEFTRDGKLQRIEQKQERRDVDASRR
jgi:hypothetical protein